MRSLNDALSWWSLIDETASLADLRAAIKHPHGKAITDGLRSVCWKALLLFEDVDRSRWSAKLKRSRDAYTSLRTMFLRAIENPDELDDPLSENDNSPWNNLRKDEELRSEIYQDIDRCMPDNLYFRQPDTQNILLDILFVWSKLNPDISYRQGMHEILAPILWVVEHDAVDPTSIRKSTNAGNVALIKDVLNANYISHDTFSLFSLVMQHSKSAYQPQDAVNSSKPSSTATPTESLMVLRSRRVMEYLLAKTDPALAAHLNSIDIIPQLFLMRWVRLLFGREFPFDEVLSMWDRIFAEDPSAECVDHVCLAMILRIRWQLLDCDNNSALSILLHYPEPAKEHPPVTFVEDAMYLKTHLNLEGAQHLIFKYTNRLPPTMSRPSTPSAPLRQYSPLYKPGKLVRPSGGFDKLLQEAAREVYSRGEKWGLNQAVRDAVGEVRKNVQGLQRTSSPGNQSSIEDSSDRSSAEQLLIRIEALQKRNRSLAKMLEGAVSELWQRQQDGSGGKLSNEQNDEAITLAIAKVQFVQVYLEDLSLPLPTEEPESNPSSKDDSRATTAGIEEVLFDQEEQSDSPNIDREKSLVTSSNGELQETEQRDDKLSKTRTDTISALESNALEDTNVAPPPTHTRSPSDGPGRPPLAHSSFSWILGQDKSHAVSPRSAFLSSTSPFTMPQKQQSPDRRAAARSSAAFLFGDDDGDNSASTSRKGSVSSKGKDKNKARKEEDLEEEEIFRLGTLKRR